MRTILAYLQIKHYPLNFRELVWVIRIAVSGFIGFFVVGKFREFQFELPAFHNELIGMVFLQLVLMIMNWAIEGKKWQLSIPTERIHWKQSVQEVLMGLSLNWIFPLSSGDLYARLAERKDRASALAALGTNRVIMLLITGCYGLYGMIIYTNKGYFGYGILISIAILIVAGYLVHSNDYFKWLTAPLLGKILMLSCFRYSIFVFQYVLLFNYFIPDLPISIIFAGIGWILFFKTFIPGIFGNFGIREASAMLFFQSYVQNLNVVIMPCMIIWTINRLIPTIVGLVFILTGNRSR